MEIKLFFECATKSFSATESNVAKYIFNEIISKWPECSRTERESQIQLLTYLKVQIVSLYFSKHVKTKTKASKRQVTLSVRFGFFNLIP